MSSEITHILQQAFDLVEGLRNDFTSTLKLAQQLKEKVTAMASIHDEIAAIFDDIEPKVASIIASKGSSDTANADLLTRAQALQTSVDAAFTALTPAASAGTGSTTGTTGSASLGSGSSAIAS